MKLASLEYHPGQATKRGVLDHASLFGPGPEDTLQPEDDVAVLYARVLHGLYACCAHVVLHVVLCGVRASVQEPEDVQISKLKCAYRAYKIFAENKNHQVLNGSITSLHR